MSAYQKLAQGRLVIKALESIATAGTDDKGLPKARHRRADAKVCRLTMFGDGGASMATGTGRGGFRTRPPPRRSISNSRPGTFPSARWRNAEAVVPHAAAAPPPETGDAELSRLVRSDLVEGPAVRSVPVTADRQGRPLARVGNVGSYRNEKAALSARL